MGYIKYVEVQSLAEHTLPPLPRQAPKQQQNPLILRLTNADFRVLHILHVFLLFLNVGSPFLLFQTF